MQRQSARTWRSRTSFISHLSPLTSLWSSYQGPTVPSRRRPCYGYRQRLGQTSVFATRVGAETDEMRVRSASRGMRMILTGITDLLGGGFPGRDDQLQT